MSERLSGKRVWVSGGSRGIGRAIAVACAEAGAHVIITSRQQEGCDEVAAEINALRPGAAIARACHAGQVEAIGGCSPIGWLCAWPARRGKLFAHGLNA